MVGGGDTAVAACANFNALAPGIDAAPRTKSDSWVSPQRKVGYVVVVLVQDT